MPRPRARCAHAARERPPGPPICVDCTPHCLRPLRTAAVLRCGHPQVRSFRSGQRQPPCRQRTQCADRLRHSTPGIGRAFCDGQSTGHPPTVCGRTSVYPVAALSLRDIPVLGAPGDADENHHRVRCADAVLPHARRPYRRMAQQSCVAARGLTRATTHGTPQ